MSDFDDELSTSDLTQSGTTERPGDAGEQMLAEGETKPYRGDDTGPFPRDEELEEKRHAAQAYSREARDQFREARSALTQDESESHFFAVQDALEILWDYVSVRVPAFKELLGLVEAAVRGNEFESLEEVQLDVIDQALTHLCRTFIDEDEVDEINSKFADFKIDICGPLRGEANRTFRITIEEIDV